MDFPNNRNYTTTHEWLQLDGPTALVGISDYAQSQLGDIVFVNLPEEGDELITGKAFADVESVKTVSEILSPVTGIVSERNEELFDSPELINQSANEAWLVKVCSVSETVEVLESNDYQAHYIS